MQHNAGGDIWFFFAVNLSLSLSFRARHQQNTVNIYALLSSTEGGKFENVREAYGNPSAVGKCKRKASPFCFCSIILSPLLCVCKGEEVYDSVPRM